MPLVNPVTALVEDEPEHPLDERWRRARRIKPQYTEGRLVSVATARNLAEADFIQNLLLEEGVPSLQRRARGFDVPDFLAAGPRDILVPASGAPAAREVLLQSELIGAGGGDSDDNGAPAPLGGLMSATAIRVLAVLIAGLALLAVLAWLIANH
jgi:hypothetical protein